ncbi:glycosyltransferase family 4 protein [Vreelandella rituensis]|uniref:Glycosyltransferase family 1 protein n=2 Tax=Vreelandella rituensis TaxID=2282306 RepID=A0A368TNS1_9GAMM|nr:glycosyltransferase family 1 protein [Halomonas rituensis]RCV86208.1 glycosyltransferase family 1 protein [Halomonas rituensis]
MRICLVSETWSPEINGVAHTLRRLSHELQRRDISLQLVRPKPRLDKGRPAQGMAAELQVQRFSIPGYQEVQLGLTTPSRLKRFWGKLRPDVIYLATQGPLGWAARRAARALGIPLVAGWHTNFEHYCHAYGVPWLGTVTRYYLRHFHNGCQLTLVPTHQQARELSRQGIQGVRVMARGINGERFSPAHRDPELRRSWGVNEHQPVALYVGRLAAEKNLSLLQESFRAMREIRPDMAQVIVGGGPGRAQLQSALPDAHFTGFIDTDDLARHYASADIFVFPSLSETWGNVVAEAMASGLAVVAYRQAASAELIDSGRNGISVTPEDSEAFRQAAVSLCQHPADYARFGRMARLRALEQSWADIADQFLSYLDHAREAYHATPYSCPVRPS